MSAAEFASLFAVAQAAPGPNMLVVTLIGWRVAGWAGALVATLSLLAPCCTLTFVVTKLWDRAGAARWRVVVQSGLTPVTVGLVLAAATLLSLTTLRGAGSAVLTVASTLLLLRTRMHPLWLLAAGAALGAAGMV